ncbi:biotin--[acetyl-CoA-carboxylase] ligase [Paeniglutamicibacter cryotolerans]|uniref:biotin--[biotin carboxyl-carrier protein] ligase n=2 Tax=Paeniglutamicibacter cryotolerans TaxID=670079 RepID=A0A839QIL3_9MICC|nr:BirA family biotin operon repressor/biotin-[acetyl-CoA-carboxylase] ligase [Paeniglutamicibacter cryotolerans]
MSATMPTDPGAPGPDAEPGENRPPLDAAVLARRLVRPAGAFAVLDIVEDTGSTNIDLADRARGSRYDLDDLTVLSAEHQSAGHGRLGRGWSAPARSSLAVSVYFAPGPPAGFAPAGYPWLSMLCALALSEALEAVAGIDAAIKWPNDVISGGAKISGLLAQLLPGAGAPAVIVGAGVNVSLSAGELPVPTATSVLLRGGTCLDRTELLAGYLERLGALYGGFRSVAGNPELPFAAGGPVEAGLRVRVSAAMATLGERVRAELPGGTELIGEATGLGSDGSLLVRTADGKNHSVLAADVIHLRRADGSYA